MWVWGSKKQFAREVGYLELGPQKGMGELIPSVNTGHGKFLEAKIGSQWCPAVFLSCKFLDSERNEVPGFKERAVVSMPKPLP